MRKGDKFDKILNQLRFITEQHGLRFLSGIYDDEGNIRTIIISDNNRDRDALSDAACELRPECGCLEANKLVEGELQ